jgi:hypothetical protein
MELPQPMLLPQCQQPSFTPIRISRNNYSSAQAITTFSSVAQFYIKERTKYVMPLHLL